MIKSVLPATVAAIALGTLVAAPLAVQAQMVQPIQRPAPYAANASITTTEPATEATTVEVRPGEYTYPGSPGYAVAPMVYPEPVPYAQPISPRTTWIPGHYNWDPATSNYVWTVGQYIEAPTATAQWIPGHWEQTPTAWICINGGWH